MAYLPNATANIYLLSDLINPIWVGYTDTNGVVIDASGEPPMLPYGDYRIAIDHCDYDTEIHDFSIPEISSLQLTIGCTSSITAHETVYNHALIGFGGLPPGIGPLPYLGTTPPSGWLLCDGSAISRINYAGLFAVIGITSGAGDGSTTFNLPDMRGRVPVGIGTYGVVSLGDIGGEQNHILTITEMPSHTHNIGTNDLTGPDGRTKTTGNYGVYYGTPTDLTGGNQAHNNMQPYLGVNYIISI